jgi:HEAT repeat protein
MKIAGYHALLYVWPVSFALFFLGPNAMAQNSKGAQSKIVPVSPNNSGEDRLIADMASDNPRKVLNALDDLQEKPNSGTNVIAAARKLLVDPRPSVRKKAARVLGEIHARVDRDDIKAICRMLKSYDKAEVSDALKALRGLNAAEAIPEITPFLKSNHKLLVRDACRTLAVLGNKDVVPLIEPLLKNADADVRTDAQFAITALRSKN